VTANPIVAARQPALVAVPSTVRQGLVQTPATATVATTTTTVAKESLLRRRIGGLPGWFWLTLGTTVLLALLAVAYWLATRNAYKVISNVSLACPQGGCDVAPGSLEKTADACKERCTGIKDCDGVLYLTKGNVGNTNCWPKRLPAGTPPTVQWTGANLYIREHRPKSS